MAVTAVIGNPSGAINYTFTTDTSADFASVANSTYFYNKADKLVRFKDSTGAVLEIFSASGGASGINGFLTQSTFGVTAILTNSGTNTATPASDTMYAYPIIMANNYTFNSMEMYCQTLLVGGNCRILIYSNLNSNPDQKIYESATIDLSTTGTKTITTTITFTKGTVYWLVYHSGTGSAPLSIRSISGLTQLSIGYRSNNATYGLIQQTSVIPLGSAPTTFGTYIPSSLNSPLIALF